MHSSAMAISSGALAGIMRLSEASTNSVRASPLAFKLNVRETDT